MSEDTRMRGSRSRKGGRRSGGRPGGGPPRQPSTPSERQEAADRAQSLRKAGEELVPAAKMAKSLGISIETVRQVIAEIEIQPDHVLDGCAYYSQATARAIREHLKR